MADAFEGERARRLAAVVQAEREIDLATRLAYARLLDLIAKDILDDRAPVVAAVPDPNRNRNQIQRFWDALAETTIAAAALKIFAKRFSIFSKDSNRLANASREFAAGITERLKGVPDEVYADLNRITDDKSLSADQVREAIRAELTPRNKAYDDRLTAVASRVARSTGIAAFNAGDLEGVQADATAKKNIVTKRWLSSHDSHVRPTHMAADDDPDNQEVPVDGWFQVGGFQAQYPGDWTLPAQEAVNCRCTVLYSTNGAVVAGVAQTPDIQAGTYDTDGTLPDGWRGPIAALDVPTSDRRMLATPANGIKTRAYPLSLTMNHVGDTTGYPVVGSVDAVWMDSGLLMGEGRFDLGGQDGQDAARQLAGGFMNRVSIDPVAVSGEMRFFDKNDQPLEGSFANAEELPEGAYAVTTFTDWTLAGLAMVPIPAYTQAAIEPVYGYQPTIDAPNRAIVAAASSSDLNSTDEMFLKGMITHHGHGIDMAQSYLDNKSASSAPAEAIASNIVSTQTVQVSKMKNLLHQDAVVAAVGGQIFNGRFFEYPNFTEPQKLTVTPEGHVYGHVREHGTCYQYGGGQGDGGFCLEPPDSACAYSKFMCHSAMLDDGRTIDVGALTFGDGHASRGSLQASVEHYNDVATQAAKVIAGTDVFGVWVSGQVLDSVADRAYDLLLSPMSGHWEPDADNKGHLEMIAVHIVNTPGYSVRRIVAGFDDAGQPNSIIITTFPTPEEAPTMTETPSTRSAVVAAMNDLKRAEALSARITKATEGIVAAAGDETISPTSTAWDGGAAAGQILTWATKNGKIDVGMASRGFLAHVGDGSKRGDWKLPVANVTGGVLHIIPRGVSAAAGRLNQTQGIDRAAAASKIKGLYSRIHKMDPSWPAAPPA